MWTHETWLTSEGDTIKELEQPHHIVAMRGKALKRWVKKSKAQRRMLKWLCDKSEPCFPHPVYFWHPDHGGNTRGGSQ
jgi:hypothetical protein